MPRYMGCGILPISDFRTLAMTFHPLIVRPTDVRSARFFAGFFSVLLEDDLRFVDVCSVVLGALVSGFLASLVRLLFSGFRFPFTVCRMNQIGEFYKELFLHRFDALFQLRGLEHRNHQLVVFRLQSLVLSLCLLQ